MGRNGNGANGARLLVADRFPLVIDGIAALLGGCGYSVVARAETGSQAAAAFDRHSIDLAILDIELGNPAPLDLIGLARSQLPRVPVVVTATTANHPALQGAIEIGVEGIVIKTAPSETLHRCVAAVIAGGQWLDRDAMEAALARISDRRETVALTRRERDVTKLVAAGQRNRTIADRLGISEGTVKMHLHNVYAKLGLESRTQLAMDARVRAIA